MDSKNKFDSTILPAVKIMAKNFFAHQVGKSAAALAYYLVFAVFPFLIFLSNALGFLDLNLTSVTYLLGQFLPGEIVRLVESYLDYVSHAPSHTLLWFSLIFSVWFPLRAVRVLMKDVRTAYGQGRPAQPVAYFLRRLVYTLLLLVVILLTLLLSVLGQRVVSFLARLLFADSFVLPEILLTLWQYARFVPVVLLMYFALAGLYNTALDKRLPLKETLPGIVTALIMWLVVSIAFSFYVENFSRYTLIYGTLGAVMMLLMWLYFTAVILIMGAEFNAALKMVSGNKG